ncbi:MAG TPA: hypothetical protein DD727_01450, partial [Clostridiales bacterium]|nr:hypothetical protein [Clostridiales bacterium]
MRSGGSFLKTEGSKHKFTKKKWKQLAELYITFFKLGSISFGGGYAMIPLIERA